MLLGRISAIKKGKQTFSLFYYMPQAWPDGRLPLRLSAPGHRSEPLGDKFLTWGGDIILGSHQL